MAEDKEITLKKEDIEKDIQKEADRMEALTKELYATAGKINYLRELLERK